MNLFDSKFKNVEIVEPSKLINYNLVLIVDCVAKNYERDIIKKVFKEAQNQADITEAKLRGISIEQLNNLKLNVSDEQGVFKEEKSNKMKK